MLRRQCRQDMACPPSKMPRERFDRVLRCIASEDLLQIGKCENVFEGVVYSFPQTIGATCETLDLLNWEVSPWK